MKKIFILVSICILISLFNSCGNKNSTNTPVDISKITTAQAGFTVMLNYMNESSSITQQSGSMGLHKNIDIKANTPEENQRLLKLNNQQLQKSEKLYQDMLLLHRKLATLVQPGNSQALSQLETASSSLASLKRSIDTLKHNKINFEKAGISI